MLRSLIPLIGFLLVSITSISQQIDIKWDNLKMSRGSMPLGLIGKQDEFYFLAALEDKILVITKKRATNLTNVFEKKILLESITKKPNTEITFKSIRQFKDHFIFYFESSSKLEDLNRLYAQKLNFDGNVVGPALEIGKRVRGRASKESSFDLYYSADSLKFLVVTKPYYEKYENEKINLETYDYTLKSLASIAVILPYLDKNLELDQCILANDGKVYFLAKIGGIKADDESEYNFEILKVDPENSSKVTGYDLKIENKYIYVAHIFTDNLQQLYCFGYYSEHEKNSKKLSGLKGIFSFRIDGNNTPTVIAKAFDQKTIEKIQPPEFRAFGRISKPSTGIFSRYKIKKIYLRPDGGFVAIAEVSYMQIITEQSGGPSSMGTSRTYPAFSNNDIMVVSIDPQGEISWINNIPKKQFEPVTDWFGSFHSTYQNENIYIVYNDEIKNATTNKYTNASRDFYSLVPVVLKIDKNGDLGKKLVLNKVPKETKGYYFLFPQLCKEITSGKVLLLEFMFPRKLLNTKLGVRNGVLTITE